jgi:polysaccharide biosynthesis/export protein
MESDDGDYVMKDRLPSQHRGAWTLTVVALIGMFLAPVSGVLAAAAPADQKPAPTQTVQAPTPTPTPPAATTPAPPAAGPVEADSKDYKIGPGDSLQIYVWQHPDLSVTIPVRPDGKISTPLVEDLVAVAKTPHQLARDIETALKVYIRTPQVNVIVTNPMNAFNQVKIIGQVKTPGSLAFRAGMTVMDAILQVGGLSEFAAGNRATLVRTGDDGKEQRIKLKLNDLINKGRVETNVPLRPGDMVIVPEAVF